MKTLEKLITKSIKAAYFSRRNWEKVTGPLERLETNSSLINKNLKKKKRHLKIKLDKTLNNYYNLNIKRV